MPWSLKEAAKEELRQRIEYKKTKYNQLYEAIIKMKKSIEDDYQKILELGE